MNFKNCLRKVKWKVIVFFRITKRRILEKSKRICKFPNTIQFPITHKCNFDCVMCGMEKMKNREDFSANDIRKILSNKLFSYVETIGINGGEPFIRTDLVECVVNIINALPSLKRIYFISNGYFVDRVLEYLPQIKKACNEKDVNIYISFSVDGINDMQDFHRGHKKAFSNVCDTISQINKNRTLYVDGMDIICTITRFNIYRINEVEAWANKENLEVSYNIATENARIENEDKLSDFSVLGDEKARMLSQEFFYTQYLKSKNEKYFALYLYLKTGKRYGTCPCMYNEWITITPDSQIGFCATHSEKLGSALEESAFEIVNNNREHLIEIGNKYCNNCSHYMYSLNGDGLKELYDDWWKNTFFY